MRNTYTLHTEKLFTVVILLLLAACSKDDKDNGKPADGKTCFVTKSYIDGDTSQYATKFIYNSSDLVVYVDGVGSDDYSISYESNKITIRGVPPYTADNYTVYYLRSDSMAYASAYYLSGVQIDTTLYFYDAGKYLAKSVRYTSAFGKDSVLMTYSAGNLQKIIIYNSNGTKPQATFEYYNDSCKSWMYQAIAPYNNNGYYYPWLGKGNKNLIKSFTTDFYSTLSTVSIKYTINAKGYADDYITTSEGGSAQTYFEYKCR
ncbi:MAG: hypothetical protein QM725_12395 [Lacibacter sp.]